MKKAISYTNLAVPMSYTLIIRHYNCFEWTESQKLNFIKDYIKFFRFFFMFINTRQLMVGYW